MWCLVWTANALKPCPSHITIIIKSSYISNPYHYLLPLAFFFSRSLLTFISWIRLGDSAASPSGVQQLYNFLLSMGTAERGSITLTHRQWTKGWTFIHLSGERKRATAMKWSYILCICSNVMTKSPPNGSAAHVSHYQQVQDESTAHVVVMCCNLIINTVGSLCQSTI